MIEGNVSDALELIKIYIFIFQHDNNLVKENIYLHNNTDIRT